MKDSYENPEEPFHLWMNPLKGILSRYDFENLDWPQWFAKQNDAVKSSLYLMNWMNENFSDFAPVTVEVFGLAGN